MRTFILEGRCIKSNKYVHHLIVCNEDDTSEFPLTVRSFASRKMAVKYMRIIYSLMAHYTYSEIREWVGNVSIKNKYLRNKDVVKSLYDLFSVYPVDGRWVKTDNEKGLNPLKINNLTVISWKC